jgi:hypothetical protein
LAWCKLEQFGPLAFGLNHLNIPLMFPNRFKLLLSSNPGMLGEIVPHSSPRVQQKVVLKTNGFVDDPE